MDHNNDAHHSRQWWLEVWNTTHRFYFRVLTNIIVVRYYDKRKLSSVFALLYISRVLCSYNTRERCVVCNLIVPSCVLLHVKESFLLWYLLISFIIMCVLSCRVGESIIEWELQYSPWSSMIYHSKIWTPNGVGRPFIELWSFSL